MPLYTIRHKKTKKEKTIFLFISELDDWEKMNENWEVACGSPGIHSGIGLGLKSGRNDDSFKEAIKEIKKNNPYNTVDNYYNK